MGAHTATPQAEISQLRPVRFSELRMVRSRGRSSKLAFQVTCSRPFQMGCILVRFPPRMVSQVLEATTFQTSFSRKECVSIPPEFERVLFITPRHSCTVPWRSWVYRLHQSAQKPVACSPHRLNQNNTPGGGEWNGR